MSFHSKFQKTVHFVEAFTPAYFSGGVQCKCIIKPIYYEKYTSIWQITVSITVFKMNQCMYIFLSNNNETFRLYATGLPLTGTSAMSKKQVSKRQENRGRLIYSAAKITPLERLRKSILFYNMLFITYPHFYYFFFY